LLRPTIGDLLPSAVAVAVSPVPIEAVILLLGIFRAGPTARRSRSV
jgi:hypothetical protein